MQIRIARPTRSLEAMVSFYGGIVGLPVVTSFQDHDGYSGVVFGLPDSTRQLELVSGPDVKPSPTTEDMLILFLESAEQVAAYVQRLRSAGREPQVSPNPFFARQGAVCFVDPDGYWLVFAPGTW